MRRLLVIEPDGAVARELAGALGDAGADTVVVGDVEAGWRALGDEPFDAVLCALTTPRGGAAGLLRRAAGGLPSERRPPIHVLFEADQIEGRLEDTVPRGAFARPVWREALGLLVHEAPPSSPRADLRRLEKLFGATTLAADIASGAESVARRCAEAFEVAECVIWSADWHVSSLAGDPEAIAVSVERGRIATRTRTTTWVGERSVLAANIGPAGADAAGGIALASEEARAFTDAERTTLELLARRLGVELSWVAAHGRLLADHDELRESALVDPLTGLWSRGAFEDAISAELSAAHRRKEPLALALFDVRGLRRVNDHYGHEIGDMLLSHVARIVRANVRAQDSVARYAGDELAVLFVGADAPRARIASEKLIAAVDAAPLELDELRLEIGMSAVVTDVDTEASDGEAAFARVLAAKRRGRNDDEPVVIADRAGARSSSEEVATLGPDVALGVGATLGGMYRILHEISRGAMGVVYRAQDLGLGRPVAIKVLRTDLAADRDLVTRFREEAAMLASLRHRNLVQVYSFGSHGEEVYFVMELVEGQALVDVLERLAEEHQQLELPIVTQIVEEIADALEAMHSIGLIHRDVKPANVLLDHINDRAVLVDVGVAKRREDRGDTAGTPGFAAPESFMETPETLATDVYGLAATCYMMLTGRAPFGSGEVVQVVERQLYERPELPSEVRDGLATAVDGVLLKALEPDQDDRYGSAGAFAVALASALKRSRSETASRARISGTVAAVRTTTRRPLPHRQARAEATVRGVVFRVAQKLLVHHLGTSWVKHLAEHRPDLAEVLRPTLAAGSWAPLRPLVELLRCAGEHLDARRLAAAIGRGTATASLSRFLGADPTTLTPAAVVRAASAYWPRYHAWSRLEVTSLDAGRAAVRIVGKPGDRLIWALCAGSLTRAAEMADAVRVTATTDEADDGCGIELRWSLAGATDRR